MVVSRFVGAIRGLVNVSIMQPKCASVLRKGLVVAVLMYGSEAVVWKEKERSKIRAVYIDYLKKLVRFKE